MSNLEKYLDLYKDTINLLYILNRNAEKIFTNEVVHQDINANLIKYRKFLEGFENVDVEFHSRREDINAIIKQIIFGGNSKIVDNISNLKIKLTGLKFFIEKMKR